jgi:hypothetical protein
VESISIRCELRDVLSEKVHVAQQLSGFALRLTWLTRLIINVTDICRMKTAQWRHVVDRVTAIVQDPEVRQASNRDPLASEQR